MANIKSAKKRIQTNERNRIQNRFYRSSVRTYIKTFFNNLEIYQKSQSREDQKKVEKLLQIIYSIIDKGIRKKIFHKNNGSKKKAKLAAYLKSVKPL